MIDSLIIHCDRALRTIALDAPKPQRASPAEGIDEPDLNEQQRQLSASLMRVNHTGEVCAQALYRGQTMSAGAEHIAQEMQEAAEEEADHLAWCEQRLQQLGSHTSYLNPLFYILSFGLGYTTGKISDAVSLGFIGATEDQVCQHLEKHQQKLPTNDTKSHAIVEQMISDEKRHGDNAMQAGGVTFPQPVKQLMTLFSKVMTESTSRI